MRKKTVPAFLLLALYAAAAPAAEVTAPHVRVTYDGISEPQAKAIAETLSAAREVYVTHFGFDMPETVRCSVEYGRGKAGRLYTDGNDRIFLSSPSPDTLPRPTKSGTFNLYGLCHELGHVAMYRVLKRRDWMTGAAAEGWAHYAGSVVVDEVYKARGDKLWTPDPYDYRVDGTARLERQLKDKSPSEVARAAGEWQKLGTIVGPRGFRSIFQAWEEAHAAAGDTPPTAPALAAALERSAAGKGDAAAKWWGGGVAALFEARENSAFKKAGIDRSKLERRPVTLGGDDDGAADGKKSIAGGGHARRFAAPGTGEWYLTSVSVHGARYGPPRVDATFDVALCDAEMRPVATWKHPYAKFDRAQAKWVRLEVPPTRVPPGGLYVVLDFRPTASQGVYVSFDNSRRDENEPASRVATPGKPGRPLAEGEWMFRIELDRPKAADALSK